MASISSSTISSGVYIYDGELAYRNTIVSGGWLRVHSGGTANSNTVNSYGALWVFYGGTANSTTVNSDGDLVVSSGGTALQIKENGGYVDVADGADVTFTPNTFSGLVLSSYEFATVHSGTTANATTVNSGGRLNVFSGGTANATTVNSYGILTVYDGGRANSTIINSAGGLHVFRGGNAIYTTVNDGGSLYVFSGGTANATTVNSGGSLKVSSGGTALNIVENGGYVYVSEGANVTFTSNTFSGLVLSGYSATVHSGTTANKTKITSYGSMTVSSGGVANGTTLNGWYAIMTVLSGGTVNSTSVESFADLSVCSGASANSTVISGERVSMIVQNGGTAADTVVNSGGMLFVESGAAANHNTINNAGSMELSSGGTANDTTINYNGHLYVFSGGIVDEVTVNPFGWLTVYSGGTALRIKENGGYAWIADSANVTFVSNTFSGLDLTWKAMVHSGTTAVSTTISSDSANGLPGGYLEIFSSGKASATTINSSGLLSIFSGGTAAMTTVKSGGSLAVHSDGKHSGTLQIASGAVVSAYEGSIFDFSVAGRTAQDGYLINNLSLISGTPTFTITLDENQAWGTYKLAQGADSFSGTISIGTETESYGSITVNGDALNFQETLYTLVTEGNDLLLTISESSIIENLVLIDSSYIVSSGRTAISAIVSSGGELLVSSGGTANDTTLNYDGNLNVHNGGVVNSATVNAFGWLTVYSGGTALAIKENGGYVWIADGANASFVSNTFSGLDLTWKAMVHSGTTAVSTTISSDSTSQNPGLLELFSNGMAYATMINSGGRLEVYSGGTANGTTVNSSGYLGVYSGGTANKTTVNYAGDFFVSSGGTANETTINSGVMHVFSGTANSTTLNSGLMAVVQYGTASSTTINAGGRMNVVGMADMITVNSGGFLNVNKGGRARQIKENGGYVIVVDDDPDVTFVSNSFSGLVLNNRATVHSGTTANSTTVNASGSISVFSGGTANETTLNSGGLMSISGGTANGTTVNSGASLTIYSGGLVRVLQIEDGAIVSAYEGAEINFDLTDRSPSDDVLVTRQNLIQGSPSYTITVSATQETGIYQLAGGADSFASSITITSTNEASNTLTLDNTVTLDGQTYSLDLSNKILTLSVSLADTTPPVAPTASANITTATNQNVTVTAVFSDDSAKKQYSFDDQTWNDYTDPIVMSENGTVFFRGIDESGNISDVTSYTVTNIDKVAPDAPTAIANITSPTNLNVTVVAFFSADSAEKQYSLDGNLWNAYDSGVEMSENGTVFFRGIDKAGNISEITTYTVTNIDKVAPDAPIAIANITDPTTEPVTVTAIFSVDSILKMYSLDGNVWSSYTKPITMTDNGTLFFRGTDEAGNISEITSYVVDNIQKVPPEDLPDAPENLSVTVKNYDATLTWNKVTAPKDMKVSYEVRIDGEKSFTTTSNKYTFKKADVGEHTFDVRAVLTGKTDIKTSDWSDDVSAVVLDVTAPTVGTLNVTQNGEDSVLLTWTHGTDNVGIDHYIVTCGKQEETVYFPENEYTFDGLAGKLNVTLTAVDAADNKSKVVKKTITLKDVTPPDQVTGLDYVDNGKAGVILSWEKPFDNVDVTEYQVTVDGKTYKSKTNSLKVTKLKAGEHSFNVVALDKAKNMSEVSEDCLFEVADYTPPVTGALSLEQDGEDGVRLTWTPGSDDVGVDHYVVTCGEQEDTVDSPELEYTFYGVAGKVTATLTAVDAAGNAGKTVKKTITLKDMTPPDQVTGLYAGELDNKSGGVLAWEPAYDNVGVTQYLISVEDENGKKTSYTSKTNSVKVKKMPAGEYKFTVIAVDKAKNRSKVSEDCWFEVEDAIAPKVSKLTAKVTNDSALVTWKATDETCLESLELSLDGGDAEDVTELGSYTFSGLSAGDHKLRLIAYDESGKTASKEVSFKVKEQKTNLPAGAVALDTASAVSPESDYEGEYYAEISAGESRLFRFSTEVPSMLNLYRSYESGAGTVTVYREAGTGSGVKIGSTKFSDSAKELLILPLDQTGTYYISGTAGRNDDVMMHWDFASADFENNSLETATVLEIADYYERDKYLCAADPVDWFKFTVDEPGTYEYGASHVRYGKVSQTLYDANGSKIASKSITHDSDSRYFAAGDYYLKCEYAGKSTDYTVYAAQNW